jgi:uncharacterized protein YcaQ
LIREALTQNEISLDAVRAVMLDAQGLTGQRAPATKPDVRSMVRQLHALQIDTINVVARSPYLVLWSRLGEYDPRWLDELLAEGALFESWAHAACFIPIEDYPLYRALMLSGARWGDRAQAWLDAHSEVANTMLEHIRDNGPVRSSDFERTDGPKGTWWNWKIEKLALEFLLDVGDLMIARRNNFQRVYDLRERVLPGWDDSKVPSLDQVYNQFVLNSVEALGVSKPEWIADYARLSKPRARVALNALTDQGLLKTVPVQGWSTPGYYHPANEAMLTVAREAHPLLARTTLLSPFDPIVWHRARALDLFGFDYRIECYTPVAKRKYGYFTLPILYKNALVGRLDPKAHRKEGIFEVKSLHLEPGVEIDDELVAEVRKAIEDCAAWHKTPHVVVRQTTVAGLARQLSD